MKYESLSPAQQAQIVQSRLLQLEADHFQKSLDVESATAALDLRKKENADRVDQIKADAKALEKGIKYHRELLTKHAKNLPQPEEAPAENRATRRAKK